MGDIKSAREIAMEKVEKLGEASEEERLRWKYAPEGEKLAARYLKERSNLVAELGKYEAKAARYVVAGASEVLVRNLDLPRDDAARRKNKRAMDGLKTLKQDKASVENVFSGIRRIFDHYQGQGEQQKKQSYESLKAEFTAKVQQAIQQQYGGQPLGFKINVERQPQFQEEWRRVLASLDAQYYKLLDEYKRELAALS
ncbi:MAG TPA: hypothetical protein G4O09_07095 [Dehalococcoidia bacterium]|nr:hypothetical protein [Dehalococcoidia bacterium]